MDNQGDAIQQTQKFLNRYSASIVEARTEHAWAGITEFNFQVKFCSEKDWRLMLSHIEEGLMYRDLIEAAESDKDIADLIEKAKILKKLKGL